jgi:hypothetical protein
LVVPRAHADDFPTGGGDLPRTDPTRERATDVDTRMTVGSWVSMFVYAAFASGQ